MRNPTISLPCAFGAIVPGRKGIDSGPSVHYTEIVAADSFPAIVPEPGECDEPGKDFSVS